MAKGEGEKGILEGAELSTFCPHCYQGLSVFDPASRQIWVRLTVSADGDKGELLLSPKIDAFERQLSIELGEGRVVEACRLLRLHEDRLPLARHVARRPSQDQTQGATAEEA